MASEDRLNIIIGAVVDLLGTVTGIGHVHDYVRWTSSEEAFNAMAVTGTVINVWQVTRLQTEERWLTMGEVWRTHTLAIYGAYGLLDADATEHTFQNLLERAANRFRTRRAMTLDERVESIAPYMGPLASASPLLGAVGGLQIQSVEHRSIQNKLAHWAELRLGIQELPTTLAD